MMGAGACPEQTEAQLLHEALELDLGFSESQLSTAIKHLLKEYGSDSDAPSYVRQDNFAMLVNHILDHDDNGIFLPTSESVQGRTELDLLANKQEKKAGAKSLLFPKEIAHGISSGRTALSKTVGSNIDQQKDLPIRQKHRLEKQYSQSHHEAKVSSRIVKSSRNSSESGVGNVKNLDAGEENAHGHSFANKAMLSNHINPLSPLLSKAKALQKLGEESIDKDQSTKKERRKKLNKLVSIAQKKGTVYVPGAIPDFLLSPRTLAPSGCEDLATGHDNHQGVRSTHAKSMCPSLVGERNTSAKLHALDKMHDAEYLATIRAKRRKQANEDKSLVEKPGVRSNCNESNNICSNTSKDIGNENNCLKMGADSGSLEVFQQKRSCTAMTRSLLDDSEPECLLFRALEASLKERNFESALEALEAWKVEREQQMKIRQNDTDLQQGKVHDMVPDIPGRSKGFVVSYDISRGLEKLPISCVNEYNTEVSPENFLYVTKSVIRQAAHVDTSLSRIGDLHCCCSDDCLKSAEACKCTDSTRGEYAYDGNGRLIERLAIGYVSGCTTINGDFITECCDKCRCNWKCGNRIVQRGITKKLQVFMTRKKGWGVRALEKIPARSFVFEYLGEIATNSEQYDRNLEYRENGVYTYVMCLDADFDMERKHFKEGLTDHEALVLDATIFGNVSRFVNHRCNDANLFMRPVQIETRDTHYYHAALFAARDIEEMDELTWDYGIDFEDDTHLLKAFTCYCKSLSCRDKARLMMQDKGGKGLVVKPSRA